MKLTEARETVYSLPVEVLEMILNYFPVIDQLTSLGAGEAVLWTYDRDRVFSTLSATSKHLWEVLCVRLWITRVLPRTNKLPSDGQNSHPG
jgi:hypothetical protein